MTKFRLQASFAALCVVVGMSGAVAAKDFQAGALKIAGPWARATPKGAAVGGGYMSITNTGTAADKLTGGSLDDASRVEVHEMKTENGIMTMHPVPDGGLEIKPGETVTLQPGGYHMMFMGLKAPFRTGDTLKGTLTFEKAGAVPVEFAVQGLATKQPGAADPAMKGMKGM